MQWRAHWLLFEQRVRALDEALAGLEPEAPPSLQDVVDQLDGLRWSLAVLQWEHGDD
jgi:hypothetical protein